MCGAPAEVEFGAFEPKNLAAGGDDFNDFDLFFFKFEHRKLTIKKSRGGT